jgi:hypothetical protein
MSKGNLKLEELLLQANSLNEQTAKASTNSKKIYENTVASVLREFIDEAIEDESEQEETDEFDETEVDDSGSELEGDTDAETEVDDLESMDDETEVEIDMDSDDEEGDEEFSDEESDEDMPIDLGADADEPDFDTPDMGIDMGGEEDVMDLTNASEEEVLQALKNLPDNAVIQIVKKSSFDVNTSGGASSMPTEYPSDDYMGGEDGEFEGESEEEMGEEEPVYEFVKNRKQVLPQGKRQNDSKVVAENQMLKSKLAKMQREMKTLMENEQKAVEMLKKMMSNANKLAIVNNNLMNATKLFTEHSTTKNEKLDIIKRFDSAKTINESNLIFQMMTESFQTRTVKKPINVNSKDKVEISKPSIVKEERTFTIDDEKPENKIMRIMNYKSTL